MDIPDTLAEINSLSIDERIRLVEAIWAGITSEAGQPDLTEPQKEELERRLKAHRASPKDVVPWEDVKAQALERSER
ncbi:MAG: addiction module protein [Desulfomonilaceae bacterium]|nr:addiction module protein [Desulfomonilaceae bacterium]